MKQQQRAPSSSVPIEVLVARGAEALQQARFKDAIEAYKLLLRHEPRPEWKAALADAYVGRARALAAKGMAKEAAMVLENTRAPDGTVGDSWLYATCLMSDGQQQKAAAYLLHGIGRHTSVPAEEQPALEALTAALLVAAPVLPEPARDATAEAVRWHTLARAARAAIGAWIDGAQAEALDMLVNAISLRSAFRPVRLLLKSLTSLETDDVRARQLLETIAPDSPFFPLRQAVEAALLPAGALDGGTWNRLTPAQQAFVAETRGLPAAAREFLARAADAARSGPALLFAHLLKQRDLPRDDVRSACLSLLPQLLDRLPQFDKSFGPLSPFERHRVKALAAEARGDWAAAESFWRGALTAIDDAITTGGDARQGRLSQGVILRHLARLAAMHEEIEANGHFGDAEEHYLQAACEADPHYLPSVLALIGLYRREGLDKEWHRVTEDALQRFPEDGQVLQQAIDSAMARKAYKKATGFARRLLRINAVNPGLRRQMIDLHIAHARKQMRSKRPDLAARELAAAADWERADAPSGPLLIARALVAMQSGETDQAETWLHEGVERTGGGVAGWLQAEIEAALMKCPADAKRLHAAQVQARQAPPTRDGIMAIVALLARKEVAEEAKRAVASLLLGLRPWLLQGAAIDWSPAEFQALAETLVRFGAFDLLHDYAQAGRARDPANDEWRFHEAVARTRGNTFLLTMAEMDELAALAEAAARRGDMHAATRIERFLGGTSPCATGHRRRRSRIGRIGTEDDADIGEFIATLLQDMPKHSADGMREMAEELGPDAAVTELMKQFRASSPDMGMPEPMLREVFAAMVAKAMQGGRSPPRKHDGPPPGLPF